MKTKNIIPAFEKNNIPILLVSSNKFVPFLSIVVISIILHSKDINNYDIIVIENMISSKNKTKLKAIINKYHNFSIRFVAAEQYLKERTFHTAMHITAMTYLRLAIIDIFSNYKKAVYLDCDIVVNKDIAELFNIDIGNNYIGAIQDSVMDGWCNDSLSDQKSYNLKVLNLQDNNVYFNGGVLLFNIAELRKSYTTEDLLKIATSYKWRWFDQDILNMICKNHVAYLDNRWNVMCHLIGIPYPEQNSPMHNKYLFALSDPWILHYAGRTLPCYWTNVHNSHYFWKIAKKSPFYFSICIKFVYSFIINLLFPFGSVRREKIKQFVRK